MKISFNFPLRILQLAVLVFGLTGFALAQSATSEVNGVVKDPTGAVISGATIHLIDVATNTQTTTTATDDGRFLFANVRPGVYRIIAEHTGFSKKEIQDIKVDVCSVHSEYRTISGGTSGNCYRLSFRCRCSDQHN